MNLRSRENQLFIAFLSVIAFSIVMKELFPAYTITGKTLRGLAFLAGPPLLISIMWKRGENGRIEIKYPSNWASRFITISILLFSIGVVVAPLPPLFGYPFYPEYILSDMFKILWLVCCGVFVSLCRTKHYRIIYVVLITVSGIILAVETARNLVRIGEPFGQPHLLTVAVVTALGILHIEYDRTEPTTILILSGFAALSYGQVFLGNGKVDIVSTIVIAGIAVIISARRKLSQYLTVGCIALLLGFLIIFPALIFRPVILKQVVKPFQAFFFDTSMIWRFNEAYVAIVMQDYSPVFFGYGHGGVYQISTSLALPNTATAEGFSHPIHIGPVLLMFRYGILGLVFYVFVGALLAATTANLLYSGPQGMTDHKYVDAVLLMAYLTCLGFFVQFLTQSSLIDPLFGFSIAILAFQRPLSTIRSYSSR